MGSLNLDFKGEKKVQQDVARVRKGGKNSMDPGGIARRELVLNITGSVPSIQRSHTRGNWGWGGWECKDKKKGTDPLICKISKTKRM